mmetsp:Transcript_51852/g.150872  ORF Transcript_51852/g.150872 Transcript_51852/m.150872 type:complete len:355 (-) Transcript_51852:523-1587(-)
MVERRGWLRAPPHDLRIRISEDLLIGAAYELRTLLRKARLEVERPGRAKNLTRRRRIAFPRREHERHAAAIVLGWMATQPTVLGDRIRRVILVVTTGGGRVVVGETPVRQSPAASGRHWDGGAHLPPQSFLQLRLRFRRQHIRVPGDVLHDRSEPTALPRIDVWRRRLDEHRPSFRGGRRNLARVVANGSHPSRPRMQQARRRPGRARRRQGLVGMHRNPRTAAFAQSQCTVREGRGRGRLRRAIARTLPFLGPPLVQLIRQALVVNPALRILQGIGSAELPDDEAVVSAQGLLVHEAGPLLPPCGLNALADAESAVHPRPPRLRRLVRLPGLLGNHSLPIESTAGQPRRRPVH